MHVKIKSLGEVADIITGVAEDQGITNGIEYFYFQPNSFNEMGEITPLQTIFRKEPVTMEQLVKAGDVLVKRLNPNYPCLINKVTVQAVVSPNLFIVRPTLEIEASYLAFLFEQPGVMAQIEHLSGASAAIKAISAKKLLDVSVQLVPIEKQRLLGNLWLLNKRRKRLLHEYVKECDRLLFATIDKFLK